MWMIGVPGVILLIITVKVSGTVLKYSFDSHNVCHAKSFQNVITRWLDDNEIVIINAKSASDNKLLFSECIVKLGPSSESRKKTVKIKVDSFYIRDCGVFLAVQQSPTAFFNQEVTTLFNFSCKTEPASEIIYHADANNNIKIFLQKNRIHLLDYNFILNITLVKHAEVTPGLSPALVIGICVVIAIGVIGCGCILYRYLKITKFSKQHCETEARYHPRNLTHQMQDSPHGASRYSNLPLGDIEPSSSMHSQTCIVGSQGSDGSCTVCHRHHDDFAHVVDIGPNGEIVDSHSHVPHQTSHIRASDRDTLLLRPDSRSSAPRSRPVVAANSGSRLNQPLSGSASRLAHPVSQHTRHSGHLGSGELMVDYDEDYEIDVSGNDLIPPSYDLSPPSYDEAVNMPKPEHGLQPTTAVAAATTTTAASHNTDVLESDPLYQNIDSLSDIR